MDPVELTRYLFSTLVGDPDSISVKQFESEKEDEILIQVLVSEDDMGKVIGKGGKIANAVRTLVQASSYLKDNKKIRINIDSV